YPITAPRSATQDASNKADADASNRSKTDQDAKPTQRGGDVWCWSGCGGNGQEQNVVQIGKTEQDADADAFAKQTAVNANSPEADVGGKVGRGPEPREPDCSEQGRRRRLEQRQDRPGRTPDAVGGKLELWLGLRWSRAGAERPAESEDTPTRPFAGVGATGGGEPLDTR